MIDGTGHWAYIKRASAVAVIIIISGPIIAKFLREWQRWRLLALYSVYYVQFFSAVVLVPPPNVSSLLIVKAFNHHAHSLSLFEHLTGGGERERMLERREGKGISRWKTVIAVDAMAARFIVFIKIMILANADTTMMVTGCCS